MAIDIQKRDNILVRIDGIIEKLEVGDESSILDRNQIRLVLTNLRSSINNCDEKFLLTPLLTQTDTQLASIESSVNSSRFNVGQSYLYELIKIISHLNNANGKHNLQGYQQAVNSNIKALEKEVLQSIEKLGELKKIIDDQTTNFKEVENKTAQEIIQNKAAYETELKALLIKYENFIADQTKKQSDLQEKIIDEQQVFKKEYADQIIALKTDISETKINFNKDKKDKLDELSTDISTFIKKTDEEIKALKDSATAQIGQVASATFSNSYRDYADVAAKSSKNWYIATMLSMIALVGLSIWWFVFTSYSSNDYFALIAKVCATVGVGVISRYCAIQASKNKVIETKLRKIQLQMGTFDAFVASLDKETQDQLKIELTHKLIDQNDWLAHDKEEVEVIKNFEKIINKFGYIVEIKNKEK